MHSQEPWQSRSPTGSVNKPLISSTLKKKGHKGPHHSYGRGLPVKRKALIILSIAILAFAMIPALGAGAATGVVKIVTPDELANPSGTKGSDFDKLDSADYVSDKTGTLTSLEDAGGTLYAVIEDNDSDSNKLNDYHAYFRLDNNITVTDNNQWYYIRPNTSATGVANADAITDTKGNLIGDDAVTAASDEEETLNALVVGNRDREGGVDGDDLVVEVGLYIPAVEADPDANPPVVAVPAKFLRMVTEGQVFVGTAEELIDDEQRRTIIRLDSGRLTTATTILSNRPTTGDYATGGDAVPAVRVLFASAGPNVLEFSKGSNAGQSRVQVTSSNGAPIRIEVSEKDLSAFDGTGVNAEDLAGNESLDSGVFVGIFGVIRNDFKDASLDWEPVPEDSSQTPEITVVAGNPTDSQVVAVDAETDSESPNFELAMTQITLPDVDKDNVLKANSTETRDDDVTVTIKDPERNNTPDLTADPPVVDAAEADVVDEISVTAVTVGDPDPTTGAVVITVTTAAGADTGINASDGDTLVDDIFVLSYTVTALNNNISDLIASTDATGKDGATSQSDPFDEFCDGSRPDDESTEDYEERCADVLKLSDALAAHRDNLGLSDSDDESTLLGMIIGVEHGDTLSVRYSDASPRSTRSDSAEVDLVGPTIGSVDPATGSYLDDDDFTVLFSVTDQNSGIPEEAHDPGEASIRSDDAYVQQSVEVGIGQDPSGAPSEVAELDRDSELPSGERYELDIDVSAEAEIAEGDENTDPVTVRVKVTINAYDVARNKAKPLVLNYVIDTIDPVMESAITGVGLKSSNAVDGQYVLVENQRNSIVLVFDDAIKGNEVRAQDINIVGTSVSTVTWLDNSDENKITVGNTDAPGKNATDLDYNAKTETSERASDVVEDLDLEKNVGSQDARHLLFLTLEADLATDARPTIEIDGDDLVDLADNTNRSDHQSKPDDRLSPSFTVVVDQALSNNALGADITASEGLDRTPRARIVRQSNDDAEEGPVTTPLDRSLSLSSGTSSTWSVSTNRKGLGLTASGGVQDGVYEIEITGSDDNANRVTVKKGKWELDTRANNGVAPTRLGGDADKAVAQKIEINDVVFLNIEFKAEAGEYYKDSKKKVNITGLSLETLAANAISSSTSKIAASPTVETTEDVDAASAQTSDGVKHVIALTDRAIGNYRLNVSFADEAGNTGKFGYVFKITAPAPEKVEVVPGWSLVSIPGTPQDTSIGGVFAGSAR